MNIISISTAPSNQLVGKPFYDLYATLEVMQKLWTEAVLNGFEFQNIAEWDAENPPRDEGERRLAYWADSQKYTTDQIATFLGATGVPIHAVHANRDVGIYLCSDQPEEVDVGRRLIHESLSLAEQLRASVCVFHLWDTQSENFDTAFAPEDFINSIMIYICNRAHMASTRARILFFNAQFPAPGHIRIPSLNIHRTISSLSSNKYRGIFHISAKNEIPESMAEILTPSGCRPRPVTG